MSCHVSCLLYRSSLALYLAVRNDENLMIGLRVKTILIDYLMIVTCLNGSLRRWQVPEKMRVAPNDCSGCTRLKACMMS